MIPEVIDRGPVRWHIDYQCIRGGIIRMLMYKNRLSFVKRFIFARDEDFELAQRILRDKVYRILYMKDEGHPQIYRIANYAIDATEVTEVSREEFDHIFETLT